MSGTTDALEAKNRRRRWLDRWRVLLATLTLALLYVALEQVWRWVAEKLMRRGWSYGDPAEMYSGEAVRVAELSKALEATLSAEYPHAAFQLGVQYGYLSRKLGDTGESPGARPSVSADLDRGLRALQQLAGFLGVGTVRLLPVHSTADFLHLSERMESDAGGVAARIEQATSPRLRHLFLLGAHVGTELATLESHDDLTPFPPFEAIGKHATLASVPEPLWRPLTGLTGKTPEAKLDDYQQAERALDSSLARAP